MSGTRADIARAEAKAVAARGRMNDTLAALKGRLDPAVRVRELLGGARDKGEVMADDAIEFAYERSSILLGLTGAIILLLVRKPLTKSVRHAFRRKPKWDVQSRSALPSRRNAS